MEWVGYMLILSGSRDKGTQIAHPSISAWISLGHQLLATAMLTNNKVGPKSSETNKELNRAADTSYLHYLFYPIILI